MKNTGKKGFILFVGIWLLGFIGIGTMDSKSDDFMWTGIQEKTYAEGKSSSDLQKEIEKKHEEMESAEKEKEQLKSDIAEIERKKGNITEYIRELDQKSNELAQNMLENQDSITKIKKEIKKLKSKKKKTSKKKKKQYETMKQRIKYMYENGNSGYIQLILGADSLFEVFNRAEYVSKVTAYDKTLLENYQKTCQMITKAEKEIQENLKNLEETREHLRIEEASVEDLVDKKREEVARYQNLIDDKNNSLGDTEVLLASQENDLEKLFAAEREASAKEEAEREARRKAEEQKKKATPVPTAKQEGKEKNEAVPTKEPVQTPAPAENASGGYHWPLAVAGRVSSPFGQRSAPTEGASSYHKGVDIAVPVGTAVLAAKGGTVITATYSASAGNYIAISHGNGVYSYYMHCSSLGVSVGQAVSAGQQIALSGNSGISTGPHLHFGLFMGGSYVNPLSYI